jgi:hypothetical protein
MTHPPVGEAYEMSERLSFQIHGASLLLKGLGRLIADGLEGGTPEQTKELLEIADQLVAVTINHLTEAFNVAAEVSFALSGSHQR